jgi:metal-responsive CopG/Arc/MetJ family transcriptional regulator
MLPLVEDSCWWYISSTKEKTSITLSPDVLSGIDRLAGSKRSRSAVIESVLRVYLRQRERDLINARDLEILNRTADRLNAEAEETLEYQADPWRPEME